MRGEPGYWKYHDREQGWSCLRTVGVAAVSYFAAIAKAIANLDKMRWARSFALAGQQDDAIVPPDFRARDDAA